MLVDADAELTGFADHLEVRCDAGLNLIANEVVIAFDEDGGKFDGPLDVLR